MSLSIEEMFYQRDLEDDEDFDSCHRCGGSGWIITCIDDLCHGSGECIHGDGDTPCPACNSDLMRSSCPD